MSRDTAYYDLPNGERIELPTTMPDVEEVPGSLCDGKFELPEAVKEMFKWMLLVAAPGTSAVDPATTTSAPIQVPAETHMFMHQTSPSTAA